MKRKGFSDIVQNEYFCAYPFVQISTVPAGFMRPCCFFGGILKNDDSSSSNVSKNDFQDVWNNSHFRKIRQDLLDGKKITGCKQCHIEDSYGGDSMRKRSLREWAWRPDFKMAIDFASRNDGSLNSPIRFLELKPGNLCNLKCRMCNQFDSSKYAAELKDIGAKFKGEKLSGNARIFDNHNFEFDFNISKMADWTNNNQIWESFERLIPNLEVLSFAGGEPTLIEEVYTALKSCVKTGASKNITVYFASNFTQKIDHFLDLAKSFKRFDFIASLDGKDQVQEYIRFPSKWSEVATNFAKAVESAKQHRSINILVNITLNIYNILNFTDFLKWLEQESFRSGLKEDPYNLNILMYPEYLSLSLLPQPLRGECVEKILEYKAQSWIIKEKPHIAARLDQLIGMIQNSSEKSEIFERRLEELWVYTQILDKTRKQSFNQTFPKLAESIEEELRNNQFDFQKARETFQINI